MNRQITVVHIIGFLGVGGAEVQLVSLAPVFDRVAFRTIVVVLRPGGVLTKTLEDAGIEVHTISCRFRKFPVSLWQLCRLFKRERVDVLHTHMYFPGLYGRIAGFIARVPVMVHTDHGQGLWMKWRQISYEKFALKFTALRIAVSGDIARIQHKRENVPYEKLRVIQNGVDTDKFGLDDNLRDRLRSELGFDEGAFVVGTVARLVPEKALHVLIESVAILAKSVPNVRLVIVGDGPMMSFLRKSMDDFAISNQVLFLGPRTDIPSLLSAFDAYAISSVHEGLPVALLEAMACGKPIVSTRAGGISEVLKNGENGLLVDCGNAEELARAIHILIDDRDAASDMGLRAREDVLAHYSVRSTARKLEMIYTSLLFDRSVPSQEALSAVDGCRLGKDEPTQ